MVGWIFRHAETIVQFLVTAWFASIARTFQVTMAVYGTRLEAHREALRRARELRFLKDNHPDWTEIMNGLLDWYAVNEVFLTPAAAKAFMAVQVWKGVMGTTDGRAGTGLYEEAERGQETLRKELLRFRKRTLGDLCSDLWRPVRRVLKR